MPSVLKDRVVQIILVVLIAAAAWIVFGTKIVRADSLAKPPVPVARAEAAKLAPVNPWSACHAGASIGVVAGVMDPIYGVDGYQYGVQVGCDLQIDRIVIGAFTDYQWAHVTAFSTGVDANQWSVGGRAGVLVNPSTLLFGLAAHTRLRIDGMGDTNGLAIGGGIETLLRNDVSIALEYRRATFDDISDAREHTVGVRLSYRVPVAGFNK